MNNNPTLTDMRSALFDTIQKVKSGEIDLQKAKVINELSQTVINSAKCEVDFLNALPKNVKEAMNFDNILQVSGTFNNEEFETKMILKQIEEKNKKPIDLAKNGI